MEASRRSRSPSQRGEPISERSQLLHPSRVRREPPNHEVRSQAFRSALLLFTAISACWLVLIIVNTFVHVPLFSPPSAFSFAYICLAIGCTLHGLLFFHTPTPLNLAWVLPILLSVNLLLYISATTRNQLRWSGFFSLIWCLLSSLLMVGHAVVAKKEDEEEAEYFADDRPWLLRCISIFASSTWNSGLNIILGLITINLIISIRDYAVLPPTGGLYKVSSTTSIHLYCSEPKSRSPASTSTDFLKRLPTVILEAGEIPSEIGLSQWAEENNDTFRYCIWDRPGYGYSSLAPSPHSAGDSADALSSALALAGEKGPWIVVSAGKGSIVSRIFASRNPGLVRGLILVDPLHEDFLHLLSRPWRTIGLFFRAYISPLGISRLAGLIFHGRSGRDRIYGESSFQSANTLLAELQEGLVAETVTRREVATAKIIQKKDTALAIISSGEVMKDEGWAQRQKDLTTITDALIGWQVVNAPHEVWRREEGRRAMTASTKKIIKKAGL